MAQSGQPETVAVVNQIGVVATGAIEKHFAGCYSLSTTVSTSA
jgi:hypothetical protein